MAVVASEDGLIAFLDFILAGDTFTMFLFQNNYTPLETSVAADFADATFSGYSGGQDIVGWDPASIIGGKAQSAATPLQWTHNGGGTANTIYGYYVLNTAGDLVWAERAATSFVMTAAGQTYEVFPVLTVDNP